MTSGPINPGVKCPRCGRPYPQRIITGSRVAVERDIRICPTCGELEATRDMLGWPPVPPGEWPMDADELREVVAKAARGGSVQASTLQTFTGEQLLDPPAEPGEEA